MWLTLLEAAVPFFTAGGGGALAWYMRGAMGKPKPKPYVPTLAQAVKDGYNAVESMAKDIHRMYHPEGCKCAMCEIKGDDADATPGDGSVKYCAKPCFGCTVFTCTTHPDNKPAKTAVKQKPIVYRDVSPDEPQLDLKRKQVKNLEAQLNTLSEDYKQLLAQRDSLLEERGLQSAGMYVAGKPLYMLVKDRPVATWSRPPFEPDPEKTDRQNMQELAEIIRRQAQEDPTGTVIEQFGVGPVRFVPGKVET